MQAPAPQAILLCGTPHLDWDWELPFPILCDNNPAEQIGYFNPSYPSADAFSIFEAAIQLAKDHPNTYVYSICEMGFLRAFVDANPEKVAQLLSSIKTLEILGGGITSPDNLLPHGEAFIRNYLIGQTWMKNTLGLTSRQAWLPDDFGHDSQLPVLLAAMGFQGVAFMRIPGFYDQLAPLDGSPSVYQQLAQNGVDFIWSARDGSTAIAHWLQYGYYQGSGLDPSNAVANIQNYIQENQVSSPTPYLFVAVGNDFAMPTNIPGCVTAWNGQSPAPTVKAQAGTFDDFVQLLAGSNLQTQPFYPQPFYTGCFQTRPLLKKLHYRAARALLGAEIFNTIAGFQFFAPHNAWTQKPDPRSWEIEIQGRAAVLRKGWDDLAPSTHHDYITGTGIHYVYYGEQAPRLAQVCTGAEALRAGAMREIAAQINSQPESGELPVAVFNQLGFLRNGMVELVPTPELIGRTFQSVSFDGDTYSVQPTYEGGWLFPASVGSLGYATCYLSAAASQMPPGVSISPEAASASSYILKNSFMEVGVSAASNWGIDYIYDLTGPSPTANVLGQASNQVTFYRDSNGNNYRYSNENESTLTPAQVEFTSVSAQVLETGPLRVRLLTRIQCTVNQIAYTYTLEYILVAGEPFLRMRTTGACPFGYSLMTQFTLPQNISTIARGTTYHWDDTPLVRYWTGPSMQVTHDFAIPEGSSGAPQGAIYHGEMPAWGQVDTGAVMVGGLSRNPGLNYFGGVGEQGTEGPIAAPPMGIDPDVHTLEYAFRVPTGIADPSSGAQLIEALGYNTPFVAFAVPAATSRKLPEGFALASVSNASGASQPIITAAKPAESDPNNLVLRIYQPSNASMNVVLSLAGLQSLNGQQTLTVTPVTALEQAISNAMPLATTSGGYALTAATALTTLLVTSAE